MSPRSRRRGVALCLALSVLLAACSTPAASPSSAPPITPAPPPTTEPSPSPAAAFPVTLTDNEGTTVELSAEPQVIVSLTPANTEILFELGAGDRVVATDDGTDYPDAAVALPDVATFSSVDVEQVVNLEPDLVLAGGLGFTPADAITQLRSLDIPVLVLYAPTVEGVYKDIELIGTATGTSEAAVALTSSMRAEIDAISDAVAASGTPPRVFYEIGYDATTGAIFAPAADSFVAEMVTLAGGDTITTGDPDTYEIALEKLIEQDPEVIVLGVNPFYEPTPEEVAARPGWKVMTAVANDDIRTVRDTEITRPAPRLPLGLRNLATTIRPDVTLPAAP
ncbi:MAG: putative transporter substrate binding protein precursor [Chloroflexota bacterium]|nr:putative transporter substrate binding protein precursor [Chloroflexota bacterium]